tara:strand:- start:328 stop:468 length:141 start_codon:yes stop_codon:yes gene_type:complete
MNIGIIMIISIMINTVSITKNTMIRMTIMVLGVIDNIIVKRVLLIQ